MACNAYMADITDPKHRTKRAGFMTGCFFIGYNIGKAMSGVIKEELGFMYNFGIGLGVSVLTGTYSLVFLKDTTKIREDRLKKEGGCSEGDDEGGKSEATLKHTTLEKIKQLFSIKQVKDGVK